MRLIEIPTAKIEAELAALGDPRGPNSALYAMGAVAALSWLLTGTRPPHECGPDTPAAPRAPGPATA